MAKGKASNFFVWVILLLLIVGLAGFGATNFGGSVQSVGRVGETEIEINRYALRDAAGAARAGGRAGPDGADGGSERDGPAAGGAGRVVGQAAMEDEAAALGLSVGDEASASRSSRSRRSRAWTATSTAKPMGSRWKVAD